MLASDDLHSSPERRRPSSLNLPPPLHSLLGHVIQGTTYIQECAGGCGFTTTVAQDDAAGLRGSLSKTALPDQPPPTILKFRRRPLASERAKRAQPPKQLVLFRPPEVRPPEVGNEASLRFQIYWNEGIDDDDGNHFFPRGF